MKSYRLIPTAIFTCLSGFAIFALPAAAQTIAANEWTWTGGGTDTSTNPPAKRFAASSWTDTSGNFWLFGGSGTDSTGKSGDFNDLWEFVPSSNAWTKISGDKLTNDTQTPVYGTLRTPDAASNPGDRDSAVSWTDTSGNLWLFGGENASFSFLNDLWEFNPSTKEWTWMGGNDNSTPPTNQKGQPGVYGTLGTFAAGNIPGGRQGSVSWTDKSGNFWLFGGYGVDSIIYWGYLNDLWEFNPSTNQWAWIGGSNTLPGVNQANPAVYGTLGTAAAPNVPGGRDCPLSWIDNSGNLWLFGGYGIDSTGTYGLLNDLWKYDPASNEWAWIGGSETSAGGQAGVYGSLGTPAAGNVPGYRDFAFTWADKSGNLWLFGGYGGAVNDAGSWLDDLWEYNPSTNLWEWMSGTNTVGSNRFSTSNGYIYGQPGFYATLDAPEVWGMPGARQGSSSWTDTSGNLWLFGGDGFDGNGNFDFLNDMWVYQPSSTAPAFPTAATPVLSVGAGTYTSPLSVTITDSTTGASIYYTTNGANTPTNNSTLYTSPIPVSASETLQAVAVAPGYLSSIVASAPYTLNIPADFGLSPVPMGDVTIQTGGLAYQQIFVSAEFGFTGTVSFTCSGLPANATCGFSPATVTPSTSATGIGATMLTVSATASSTASLRRNSSPFFPASGLAVALCCFGLRKQIRLQVFLLIALSVAGLGLLTSCGGSSGSGSGNSYPITVVAKSGSLSHSTTFTLTVK